jgi:hypothetical protein
VISLLLPLRVKSRNKSWKKRITVFEIKLHLSS